METTVSPTIKTIKNYIQTCGGHISVQNLIEDFRVSFNSDIPYSKYGYSSVLEMLTNIPGICIKYVDGECYVQLQGKAKPKNQNAPDSVHDDISSLCVKMKNDLLLQCRDRQRTVTVHAEKSMHTRKNPVLRRYSSLSSPKHDENDVSQSSRNDIILDQRGLNHYSPANSVESSFGSDDQLDLSWYCDNNYDNITIEFDSSLHTEPYTTPYIDSISYAKPSSVSYTEPSSVSYTKPSSVSYTEPFLAPYAEPHSVSQTSASHTDLQYDYLTNVNHESTHRYEEPVHEDWFLQSNPSNLKKKLPNYELLSRIISVINAQRTPLSTTDVEVRYYENFGEMLPERWLPLLEESSSVYIENINSNVIIYPNRSFSSIPTLTALPSIEYPNHLPWNIYITAVSSTTSFWFRFQESNYETKYDILNYELQKYYANRIPESLNFVTSEELYAARVNSNFIRVAVLHCKQDTISCLDIDSGIVLQFGRRSLYRLHEKFTNVPALASRGSLTGLERYDKCSYINCKLLTLILNKQVIAVVDFRGKDWTISLNLFIKDSSQNVNVNGAIKKIADEKLSPPKLEVNQMYDVNVLSLEENTARLQILSPSLKLLFDSLDRSKEIIESHANKEELFAKSMLDVQLDDQVYLAKYENSWQRIVVKEFASTTSAIVTYIDLNESKAIDVCCIITCSNFPDTLTYIPPQGVEVRIVKTDYMVLRYMYEKYKTKLFSIKVIEKEPQISVQMFLKLPNGENTRPINNVHLLNAFKLR